MTSQAYIPSLPEHLSLLCLPPRVQQMIVLLLVHEEVICRYPVGSVELHFHGESVKAKLGCQLAENENA